MTDQRQGRSAFLAAATTLLIAASLLVTTPVDPVLADGNEGPGAPAAFRALTAGSNHTCAILANGTLRCWGLNALGQLGLGDSLARGDSPGEMGLALSPVALGSNRTAAAVSAGTDFTCALLDNATVKCWGRNNAGNLGQGDFATRGDAPGQMGDALPTVNLGTGRTATAISAGDSHACALLDNATVKCWGAGASGRLGYGDAGTRGDNANEMGDALPTVSLGTGRTATAISAGGTHTCARLDNGTVKCWGAGASGQLGYGDIATRGDNANEMGDALPAVSLGTGRTATAISAGVNSTCALLDNGTVKCWGANSAGQLGYGDTAARGDNADEMGDALPAVNLGAGRTATGVATANTHTCALLDNATTKCWGSGANGRTGQGNTATLGDAANEMGDALPVIDLGTGRTATAITAGNNHTCATLDDATRRCWGFSGNGELGQGSTATLGDAANEMGDHLRPIDLRPPGLSGTVTDSVTGAPIPGAFVAVLRTSDFGAATSMVADGSGNYEAMVPAGSYFLYVIDPAAAHVAGFSGPPTTYTVTSTGNLDADSTMVPTRGGISGTVTDQDTAGPLGGVWVLAISLAGGISGGAFTAGNGTYTITGLPVGTYKVTFFDGFGGRAQEYWDNASTFDGGTTLNVTAGNVTTGRNAALDFP